MVALIVIAVAVGVIALGLFALGGVITITTVNQLYNDS